ncbi:hypothetical protein ABZ942_10455 [Nocardia sp. NPDC046473]|uniref:hypothetical protein n=1 Tax=Nocardia sp. NPDC046473 TaxID=3155733 RepID=UPI0033E0F02D
MTRRKKVVTVLLTAVVFVVAVVFGYYWWLFGRPDWYWQGPETIAVSGNRFALKGPIPKSRGPVECVAKKAIPLTGLEYCRVDPPEAAMAVLFWYDGEIYTFNIQDPL